MKLVGIERAVIRAEGEEGFRPGMFADEIDQTAERTLTVKRGGRALHHLHLFQPVKLDIELDIGIVLQPVLIDVA